MAFCDNVEIGFLGRQSRGNQRNIFGGLVSIAQCAACGSSFFSCGGKQGVMPYGEESQQALQTARQSLKEVLDAADCDEKLERSLSRCNRADLRTLCVLVRPSVLVRSFF